MKTNLECYNTKIKHEDNKKKSKKLHLSDLRVRCTHCPICLIFFWKVQTNKKLYND